MIMVVAFAPIVGLLLGLSSITVPWDTLSLSVVLYIVVPVIVAQIWRAALLRQGDPAALSRMLSRVAPFSLHATTDRGHGMRIVTMPIDAERHGATEAIAMNQGIKIEFIGRLRSIAIRSRACPRVHGRGPAVGR